MKIHEYNEMMRYLTRPAPDPSFNRPSFKPGGLVEPGVTHYAKEKAPPGYFYNKRGKLTKKLDIKIRNKIKKRFPNKNLDFDLFKYGVDDFDKNYDQIRNMDPDRIAKTKLRRAKPEYKEARRLRAIDYYEEQKEAILERARARYRSEEPVGKTGKTLKELTKEKNFANVIKYQKEIGIFPNGYTRSGNKNIYRPLEAVWRDLYRSSIAKGQTRWILPEKYKNNVPVNDLGKKSWGKDGYYKKIKFIDNKTGDIIKLDDTIKGEGKTLKEYLNTTIAKETGKKNIYQKALNSYDLKNRMNYLQINYKGSQESLGSVMRNLASERAGTNVWSALDVHHPASVKVNWWDSEVVFRDANRRLQHEINNKLTRDFAKATTSLEKDKILKAAGKKVDELPGGISYIFEGQKVGTKVPTPKSVIQGIAQTYKDPALTKAINKKQIANILSKSFRCGQADGISCDDPRAYMKALEETKIKAAKGDKAALSKFRKVANNMRKLKGAAALTGWGILGEIGFALPFAAMDYADGQSTARIINNASLGLFGMNEEEETISYLPEGSKGAEQIALEKAYTTHSALTDPDKRFPKGRIGMDPKRFQTAQQDVIKGSYLDLIKKVTPFMQGPRNEYFNQEAFAKAHGEVEASKAKQAVDIAKRKEERTVDTVFDYYDNYLPDIDDDN